MKTTMTEKSPKTKETCAVPDCKAEVTDESWVINDYKICGDCQVKIEKALKQYDSDLKLLLRGVF